MDRLAGRRKADAEDNSADFGLSFRSAKEVRRGSNLDCSVSSVGVDGDINFSS